jgi:hypothetical protein
VASVLTTICPPKNMRGDGDTTASNSRMPGPRSVPMTADSVLNSTCLCKPSMPHW